MTLKSRIAKLERSQGNLGVLVVDATDCRTQEEIDQAINEQCRINGTPRDDYNAIIAVRSLIRSRTEGPEPYDS